MKSKLFLILTCQFWIAAGVVAACGKNTEPPPPSSGVFGAKPESGPKTRSADNHSPMQAAQALYGTLCVSCHGPQGRGDGPMAANLDPKPRDYADPDWQASIRDDEIKAIIVKGGAAVGKSKWMPGQPQLEGDPKLDMLVQLIRSFGAPRASR